MRLSKLEPAIEVARLIEWFIAWRSKPSWAIVATKDRTVNPELERASAKRMGAKVTEMDTSRVPMLSRPQAVLDVIRAAAKAVMS